MRRIVLLRRLALAPSFSAPSQSPSASSEREPDPKPDRIAVCESFGQPVALAEREPKAPPPHTAHCNPVDVGDKSPVAPSTGAASQPHLAGERLASACSPQVVPVTLPPSVPQSVSLMDSPNSTTTATSYGG